MPTQKLTLLLQDATDRPRIGGWTESVYQEATSPNVGGAATQLAQARAALLPTTGSIIGARATMVDSPGLVDAVSLSYPGGSTLATDVPQLALILKLYGATGGRRNYMIRALPDARCVNGEYQPSSAFTALLQTFRTRLTGFQLRIIDRAQPLVNIVSIDNAGAFTFDADVTFAAGDRFQFFRARDQYGRTFKGKYFVATRLTARTGTFAQWPGYGVVTGKVRKVAFTYSNIINSDIVRVTVRKVGRPFELYSGRRKTRR